MICRLWTNKTSRRWLRIIDNSFARVCTRIDQINITQGITCILYKKGERWIPGLPTSEDQNTCDPLKPIIKLKHKIERQVRPFRVCHTPNAWELVALEITKSHWRCAINIFDHHSQCDCTNTHVNIPFKLQWETWMDSTGGSGILTVSPNTGKSWRSAE